MQKQLDVLILILYCGLIFWLSDQSRLPNPDLFENQDKLQHLLAYAVMGCWTWRVFRHLSGSLNMILLLSFGFCSLYGISDEWHQSFVIGRTPSVFDWLADSIGSLIGVLTCYRYSKQSVKT